MVTADAFANAAVWLVARMEKLLELIKATDKWCIEEGFLTPGHQYRLFMYVPKPIITMSLVQTHR